MSLFSGIFNLPNYFFSADHFCCVQQMSCNKMLLRKFVTRAGALLEKKGTHTPTEKKCTHMPTQIELKT